MAGSCMWRSTQALLLVALIVVLLAIAGARAQNCGANAGNNKCGSNNCCSQFGFCGTGDQFCKNGCQPKFGRCDSSCFPGDATVLMRNGVQKPISELSIGEEVAVWVGKDGELQYDEVYANGHTDSSALSEFIAITLHNGNATRKLQLTADHFVPVATSKGNMQYRKAKHVVVGDIMIAIDEQGTRFTVTGLETEMLKGLFNPFTMRGTILVNNIIASCHSDWFLDSTFDLLGLSHLLPSTYQAILTPIRMIYKNLGSDAYKSLYDKLDTQYNIAKSGSHFTGYLSLIGKALPYPIKGVKKTFDMTYMKM